MKLYQNKEYMEKLYQEHQSAYAIANLLNVNWKTVYRWLNKHGIETRDGSQGARKHFFNEKFFHDIDTEQKMYWFGFLMADGCVYHGSDKHSYRLQINLKADDADMLDAFQAAIGSNYKIQFKDVIDKKTGAISHVAILKVNSTVMCLDLMRHGMTPRKSLVCKMPEINSAIKHHFVRGYFDGDGCITATGRRWKCSIVGGEEMLESFLSYFEENGIYGGIYNTTTSDALSLEISSHNEIRKLYDLLYRNSSIFLERKHKKFQLLLNTNNCPAV